MLIPILLDPWLLQFSPTATHDAEMNVKINTLRCVFSDLKKQYPVEILPFLSKEDQAAHWTGFNNYRGADRGVLAQWIIALSLTEPPEAEPATITDKPCPELPEEWRKVLANSGSINDPPYWRSPMLLIPAQRKSQWPNSLEIAFLQRGMSNQRNLVLVEKRQEHTFFASDIDPWRLACVGDPNPAAPLRERTATCMRLPRPPQITSTLPLSQLVEHMEAIKDWKNGTTDRYFYLPPASWDPIPEEKQKWRNGTTFPKRLVASGPRKDSSGFLDRDDRIWVWHEAENHWDVQLPAGGYERVSYDGKRL